MSDRAVFAALAVFVACLIAQRLGELALSARNARRLAARGGREVAGEHFPLLVALHTLFPLALIAEVVFLRARPGPDAPLWVALWLAAQALRVAAIRALGERWNVRIWVLPGVERVRSGPYRLVPHPNYVAVALELLAAPLAFGAWRTALLFTALNALALRVRIRAEERALAEAGS